VLINKIVVMKKSAFGIIAVVALIFITAASFRPVSRVQAPNSIPDSVYAIFEKSCLACHSTDGNGMAKSHVNFDSWDSYTPEKMASKAEAVSKILNKGGMPPAGYRKNNPDRVPTAADVKKVSDWAQSFQVSK
jgi:cytochrome c5